MTHPCIKAHACVSEKGNIHYVTDRKLRYHEQIDCYKDRLRQSKQNGLNIPMIWVTTINAYGPRPVEVNLFVQNIHRETHTQRDNQKVSDLSQPIKRRTMNPWVDPASQVRGTISVIFGSQVSLRVH